MDEEDLQRALLAEKNRLRAALHRTKVHLMAGEYKAAIKEIEGALDGTQQISGQMDEVARQGSKAKRHSKLQ
jgi:lipopolysaccharide biosynthesis regulator YciM